MYFWNCLDEEEIDKLHPDFALFKASRAHNLPVMCQAMALNADKNWANPGCDGRSPLHQAILSVIFTLHYLSKEGK